MSPESAPTPQPPSTPPAAAQPSAPSAFTRVRIKPGFDPGWLFVLAGLAMLGATALIPAHEDLKDARWNRDRVLLVEKHREQRLTRYQEYIDAVDRQEPSLVLSLAATQLNQIPQERSPIPGMPAVSEGDASVFPSLEPPPLKLPGPRPKTDSLLTRWTTDTLTRVWFIALGSALVLLGLLPAASGWKKIIK
jgi:hypothetical protein